ncbi:MAG: hypothetical protein GF346_11995 [Candidatus Eisenbacteria bacterium]|nr:hypothetical protein [Candidatus Latescibacterota bacterium]MBD3303158.1 hypothetical protein [Candidatus Eisenbacteria bacterium]
MAGSRDLARRSALSFLLALTLPVVAVCQESIARIEIESAPVFPDTTEESLPWILRLANRLHVTTREGVIRTEMLLDEGEPYDSLRVRESERLLRDRGLFESVELTAVPADSGRIVRVRTQDLWTLSVILSAEKQADLSSLTIGMEDSNVFGTGNEISWTQSFSTDEDGLIASLAMPRLGKTRAALGLLYADLDDSRARSVALGRHPETPFDRFGWGVRVRTNRGRQRFFDEGEEIGDSRFERTGGSVFAGRYTGRDLQIGAGAGWVERRLEPRGEPRSTAAGYPPPPEFDAARHRGPILYAGAMRRRFVEARNLERYGTVEDVPIGWSVLATAGPNLLHDEDPERAFAIWSHLAGSWFHRSRFGVSVECVAQGFLTHDRRPGERRIDATASTLWHPTDRWLAVLHGSVLVGADRTGTAVRYLGTDSGLRGFPTREIETRDLFLAGLEARYWTGIEVLWTGIGFNAFTDTALPSRGSIGEGTRWRTGAGCGLLLGLKKSLRRPVRIEIAWRTDEDAAPTLTVSTSAVLRAVPAILFPNPVTAFARAGR